MKKGADYIMWTLAVSAVILTICSQTQAITDPLSPALIEPFSVNIKCPKDKEFQWMRSTNKGLDIVVYYKCGGGGEMSQTMHCTNNRKATYRRDLIPDEMKKAAIPMAMKRGEIAKRDQEPNFGLFAGGPNYDLKNGAVLVFACLAV